MKHSKYSQYYLVFGLYCLFTLCVIYFATVTKKIIGWILQIYLTIDSILAAVLNSSALGIHLRHILSLAITPILIVAIPTLIYWLIKKKMPDYLVQIIWALWIITALSRLLSL